MHSNQIILIGILITEIKFLITSIRMFDRYIMYINVIANI